MKRELADEINRLHAHLCSGLADPTRIYILYRLKEGSANVSALVDILDMPQPRVSRHLKILRESGLVTCERDGQSVIYSLQDVRVIDALDTLRNILAERLEEQASLLLT